jgi:hypothetical protein
MPTANERSAAPARAGWADVSAFGENSDHIAGRCHSQQRLSLRRRLDGRLIWFRIDQADGYAIEAKATPSTDHGLMETALIAAKAVFGEVVR